MRSSTAVFQTVTTVTYNFKHSFCLVLAMVHKDIYKVLSVGYKMTPDVLYITD